jgi:D-alanyl-D-alanine carboxypeptidase
MKKSCISLIHLSIIVFLSFTLVTPASAAPESASGTVNISDDEICYVLMDSKTGRIFAEQNADMQIPPSWPWRAATCSRK